MTIESDFRFAIFDRGTDWGQAATKERKEHKNRCLHLCVLCVLSRQFCPSGSVSSGFVRFANEGGDGSSVVLLLRAFQLSSQLSLAHFNSDQLTSNWLKPGLTQLT